MIEWLAVAYFTFSATRMPKFIQYIDAQTACFIAMSDGSYAYAIEAKASNFINGDLVGTRVRKLKCSGTIKAE